MVSSGWGSFYSRKGRKGREGVVVGDWLLGIGNYGFEKGFKKLLQPSGKILMGLKGGRRSFSLLIA